MNKTVQSGIQWLIVAALALLLAVWATTPDAHADEPAPKTDMRAKLRDEFACPGMHAEWIDAHTVQCLKEKP